MQRTLTLTIFHHFPFQIPSTSGTTSDVVTVDTSFGPLQISVVNGLIVLDWGQTVTTSIAVGDNLWTNIALSWENVDGNVTISATTAGSPTGGILLHDYSIALMNVFSFISNQW